jgi:hypothetical protein
MKKIITIYMFVLLPAIIFGQTEKQLVPSDLKQQTIVTEPATLRKGFFRAGLAFSYGAVDKYFSNTAKKEYFLKSAWGSSSGGLLILDYGITDRLMVDLSLAYSKTIQESEYRLIWPELDTNAIYTSHLKGSGIGDSYFSIKYQLIPEKENKTSLTGSLDITVPTGEKNPTNIKNATQFDLPTGNGYFEAGLTLRARKIRYPYSYTGYVEYNYKSGGSRLINATDKTETDFKDGNRFDAGGSFNFHLNEWIALANELNYYYRGKGEVKNTANDKIDPAWAVSYETRLVFQVRRVRLGEAVRIPMKGKNVSADPLYVLIVQYIF